MTIRDRDNHEEYNNDDDNNDDDDNDRNKVDVFGKKNLRRFLRKRLVRLCYSFMAQIRFER